MIEVDDQPDTLASILARLEELFGPRPFTYWGAPTTEAYSPDVTGKITEDLVKKRGQVKRKPFFIWWTPAAPHREDVATTLMGRPGPDPRPAPRYEEKSKGYTLPRPPSFNEADTTDKSANFQAKAPPLTDEQIAQLQLDYEGRAGSMLAVDDHVGELVKTLKRTDQLRNTMIVFLSDNGWLQGEHRDPGRQVPAVRGVAAGPAGDPRPGRAQEPDGARPGVQHRLRADAARRRRREGRARRWTGSRCCQRSRNPTKRPKRVLEIEALEPLFANPDIPANGWDRPYTGVRTDRYTYVVWTDTGELELYDRKTDPYELDNVAGRPGLRLGRGRPRREAEAARRLRRQGVQRAAMRIGATLLAIAGALALGAPAQAAPRAPDFHDARYCEVLELRGEVPNAVVTVWNTIGLNDCPPAKWEALDAGAIAAERGDAAVILNGPRHFLMDSAEGAHRRHRDVRRHPDAQGGDDPDPDRRRAGADALHRADDQAPQHLDLGGGPARLRAARPRRDATT